MGDSPDSKLVAARGLIAGGVRAATAALAAAHPRWATEIAAAARGRRLRAGAELSNQIPAVHRNGPSSVTPERAPERSR